MRSYSALSSISDAARAATPLTVLGKGLAAEASAEELLRRYQLGEELGRGEFGVTRRCTDTSTGEVLACKSISKRKLRSSVDIEDVRREVAIMRSLPAHPNVVRLREAFEDGDTVHLVMEVCEGGELFDRIVSRGHYTERAAAAVMRTIMEVVLVSIYGLCLRCLHICMSACACWPGMLRLCLGLQETNGKVSNETINIERRNSIPSAVCGSEFKMRRNQLAEIIGVQDMHKQ